MALARRMRHNGDASRSTSPCSTASRRDDSRFECLIIFDVFQGATTTVSAVNPCRTAFRRDQRLPASVFVPVLLSGESIRRDRNGVIRSQVGRRPWKRRAERGADRRTYPPDVGLECPAGGQRAT